jgi:predicted AAA+ superfamily ATPase
VKKHLKILKETYILELISPYCRNKRTELSKNPKAYFLDTGFRNMLIDDFSSLDLRSDVGALFEGFVFTQLKRKIEAIGGIKFWRTQSQAEVDFIVEKSREVLPIEVKYSLKEKPKIGKSFYSFLKKYQPKLGIIITESFWGRKMINNSTIYFLPAFYL